MSFFNYSGQSNLADFTTPNTISVDGENWQSGDPNTPVAGTFTYWFRRFCDQIAYLKQKAGLLAQNNTWTAPNTWTSSDPGVSAAWFKDSLSEVLVDALLRINGPAEVTSGHTFTVKSGATLVLEHASNFNDAADRTLSGFLAHVGAGAYEEFRVSVGTDGPMSVNAEQQDVYRVPQLTADRTLTLVDPPGKVKLRIIWYNAGVDPAGDGSFVLADISQAASTGKLKIRGASLKIDCPQGPANGAGFYAIDLYWNGSSWLCTAFQAPTT